MEKVCKVIIDGMVIKTAPEVLISNFLIGNAFDIELPCGGRGKCGKCKVLAEGELSPLTREEIIHLTADEIAGKVRLVCQTIIRGDCRISLIKKDKLSQIAVEGVGTLKIISPLYTKFGIAIDIGTTTIKMKLFDPKRELGSNSGRNSQIKYGADVISRIDKSLNGQAEQIQTTIAKCLNGLIAQMCQKSSVDKYNVDALVITGNTAMMYLLTQENPDSLSHTPFIASRLFGEYVTPRDIGLDLSDSTKIYLAKCMAAFIGGDISTAILSSGLTKQEETALLVDIGTNGEMALWHNNELVCCSTAAGPAFEGAQIAMGMNSVAGAIDKVWNENNNIQYTVIEHDQPKGICGSGIIDAVSVFKDLGIINGNGAFDKEAILKNNLPVFIDNNMACRISEEVYLTQKDIRMVQLAKSAICGGIYTLIDEIGISVNDIKKLYIAGGFGNYLNINNAANIGLIPQNLATKTEVIGNAALQGAVQVLINKNFSEKELIESLKINILDLGAHKNFMDNYINCMQF